MCSLIHILSYVVFFTISNEALKRPHFDGSSKTLNFALNCRLIGLQTGDMKLPVGEMQDIRWECCSRHAKFYMLALWDGFRQGMAWIRQTRLLAPSTARLPLRWLQPEYGGNWISKGSLIQKHALKVWEVIRGTHAPQQNPHPPSCAAVPQLGERPQL